MFPKTLLLSALLILAVVFMAGCAQAPLPPGPNGNLTHSSNATKGYVHEHADFGIFINGELVNLSDSVFMTEKGDATNTSCATSGVVAHLHDNEGTIAHKHAAGLTWGYFLSTLGMQLDGSCLALYNGSRYCSQSDGKTLFFWVNGKPVGDLANYPINHLDKVVIGYGPDNQTSWSVLSSQVPDLAKLESTGEGCGSEAIGEEKPLAPTALAFNDTLFSHAYSEIAYKISVNQTLTDADFNALFTSGSGAPPAAIYELQAGRWLSAHHLSVGSDYALSNAYWQASKKVPPTCMSVQAERIGQYLQANDTDMAGPAILRLQYDILPAYLSHVTKNANASASFAATEKNLPAVLRSLRTLSSSGASGDYYNPSVQTELVYLQTLPC